MITTIELSSTAIRCARMVNGRLASLDHHVIADGVDPIEALAAAPLPGALGKVAVTLTHSDLLLKPMMQPPCPPDRLDRIVRFELQASRGDDPQPVAIDWHLVRSGGDGDMRVLTLMTKASLIDRLKAAVARHDGKLSHVIPSGIGLFHAWKRQTGGTAEEDAVLLDVGGAHVHLALIRKGELLLIRSQGPGMIQLARDLAEAQGLPEAEARELLKKLGKGSPESLHDLIRRHSQAVAGLVTNAVRFAKASLQLDGFDPKLVYVAGAGALVHGFSRHIADRLQGASVRLLNPFAGLLSAMPAEQMDAVAALPSPWTIALGTAAAEAYELDGLAEARETRAAFWRTHGALRAACVGAAALLLLAGARQQLAIGSAGQVVEVLRGDGSGLVPKAEAVKKELDSLEAGYRADVAKIGFLDGERRPGRIIVELLNAIVDQQDPEACPVILKSYRVLRQGTAIQVELEGVAESARNKSTADVLRTFERGLVRAYPPIGSLVAVPKPATGTAQEFAYRLVLPDVPPDQQTGTGGDGFAITVTVDPACDPRGAALVAVDRGRNDEDRGRITVKTGTATQEFAWSLRTGLR